MSDYHWTAELARVRRAGADPAGARRPAHAAGRLGEDAAAPCRRARLLMFPDTGHSLPIEQPERFTAALLGFTGGVDACTLALRTIEGQCNCRARRLVCYRLEARLGAISTARDAGDASHRRIVFGLAVLGELAAQRVTPRTTAATAGPDAKRQAQELAQQRPRSACSAARTRPPRSRSCAAYRRAWSWRSGGGAGRRQRRRALRHLRQSRGASCCCEGVTAEPGQPAAGEPRSRAGAGAQPQPRRRAGRQGRALSPAAVGPRRQPVAWPRTA